MPYQSCNTRSHRNLGVLPALASVLLTILLGGCSSVPPPELQPSKGLGANPSAIHLFAGVDTSGSFQPHLPEAADLLLGVTRRMVPGTDYLTVLELDRNSAEVYDNAVPDSTEILQDDLTNAFGSEPACGGTLPEDFFTDIAARVSSERDPCVITLTSDGDEDGVPAKAEPVLCHVGDVLADNAHVRAVVLIGIAPENRASWRHRFRALDAARRLFILNLDSSAVDETAEIITSARQAGRFPAPRASQTIAGHTKRRTDHVSV